jgi:hypothetical protein
MIRKRVSAVFRIVDAVTGEAVGRNMVRLSCGQGNFETIYKEDGYFIAMNLMDGEFCFEFKSPYYQTDRLNVAIQGTASTDEAIPVMLQPGVNYPRIHELTRVAGKIELGTMNYDEIEVFISYNAKDKIKLAQETAKKGSASAKLYTVGKAGINGRTFILSDKDGRNEELCRIIKGLDKEGIYYFEKALIYDHKRGDSFKNAARVFPDVTGAFLAVVNDYDPDDTDAEIFVIANGNKVSYEKIKLVTGKLTDLRMLMIQV